MKKLLRLTGNIIICACVTVGLIAVCGIDAVPDEALNEVLLLIVGMGGGAAAGAYIKYIGDSM